MVHGSTELVEFGAGTSQVIIHLISDGDQKTQKGLEVLLLDRDMKVVLKSAPDENQISRNCAS